MKQHPTSERIQRLASLRVLGSRVALSAKLTPCEHPRFDLGLRTRRFSGCGRVQHVACCSALLCDTACTCALHCKPNSPVGLVPQGYTAVPQVHNDSRLGVNWRAASMCSQLLLGGCMSFFGTQPNTHCQVRQTFSAVWVDLDILCVGCSNNEPEFYQFLFAHCTPQAGCFGGCAFLKPHAADSIEGCPCLLASGLKRRSSGGDAIARGNILHM